MRGACSPGDGISGSALGSGEPLTAPWALLAGTPLTLSRLLQESKPEQCLAGKSHSPGEQPSQLGMATRYGTGPRASVQPLSASKGVTWVLWVLLGFTEYTGLGPRWTRLTAPGRTGTMNWVPRESSGGSRAFKYLPCGVNARLQGGPVT